MGVGSHVRLTWNGGDRDYNIDCTIAAIDVGWVRCATREDPFKRKPSDLWYNLGHIASVTSLETEK